jgi:transposase-like protein
MNIIQVYKQFPTEDACIEHLERVRWGGVPKCPYCGSTSTSPLPKERRHHCNACNTTFSVTVGTIFHRTHVDLQKWFLAISLVLNAKKGLSARQLGRDIEVHRNTAWSMGMRIRKAMTEDRQLLEGVVEMDECYIGGRPRKGCIQSKRGRGTNKTPVIGIVERGGRVVTKASRDKVLTAKRLSAMVREKVDINNAVVITDEYRGYLKLKSFVEHYTINHKVWYVDGDIHTNSIESFWAIVKRGIIGQYHKVSVAYLNRYLDEFCYRYNHRQNTNVFNLTIERAVGVA